MEVALAPEKLDELFEQTVQTGYTRELLFSNLVKMMTQVVCSVRQSIGSVYKAMSAEIGVSKTAVYDKLNRLEPSVSKALVQSNAMDLSIIMEQLGVERSEPLPGYRVTTSAFPCVLRRRGVARQNSFLAMVWAPQNIVCPCCWIPVQEPCQGNLWSCLSQHWD